MSSLNIVSIVFKHLDSGHKLSSSTKKKVMKYLQDPGTQEKWLVLIKLISSNIRTQNVQYHG